MSAAVQIIGAGLSGMSAARHLEGDYELHEAAERVGGHVVTTNDEGFRFDRTEPPCDSLPPSQALPEDVP